MDAPMASSACAVEVQGLTKLYGQILAVDHISFQVRTGEFFGFLGPNGAGKTTTLRLLTGIITPNDGEARVMGYPAGSLAAKQVSGVMPELSNAYLDLTAWGNLMLMAELYRLPKAQAKDRAGALLTSLGLGERQASLAGTFSMGMRKRLVLCMALLPDPQILFLDEPTSGLDVQSVRFMRAMLKHLKQEGKTIFLTTHNMEEAAGMCDRVAIINHGKIVALDTPDRLSITAGRICLVDVSFDTPVSAEMLAHLPGVSRLETAQAIEASDRLRAQAALAGVGRPGGRGGGSGQGRRQGPMAGGRGAPAGVGAPEAGQGPAPGKRARLGGPERAAPGVGEGGVPGMGAGSRSGGEMGEGTQSEPHRFRLYTEDTTLLVTTLVDFSRARALQMHILHIRPPSLEDAFVRLTEETSREP
jgi:ABC-2 type transport system ATP-binding protein